MRSVLVRSLAVLVVGGAALAGILYVASTVDGRPPVVTRIALTQHLGGDETVALTTSSVEVVFSEAVDRPSAEAAFAVDPPIDGSFSWSGATLTFTPLDPLPLDAAFRVTLAPGVRDAAGNPTEVAIPFAFTTVGPPRVAGTTPSNGSEEVPRDAPIEIVFSTLMDTTSVEEALRITPALPYDLRWSGERLTIVPAEPLDAGRRYRVTLADTASDLGGTPLDERLELSFVTSRGGLEVVQLIPADGVEGAAATTPIAILFDRALDPDAADEAQLSIEPEVAGSLEAVPLPGAAAMGDDGARLLRFAPSGPLPPNTTFEVTLTGTVRAADGDELAEAVTWTFTTGVPSTTLSNQVVFLADRAGVSNVWAMNPDGTNQRQVTAELSPVTDYAVAPDGRSLVVGDGAQLVEQLVDGRDRRVLTDAGHLEFDPTYAPDGRTIAFGRADAETGAGLGIWLRGVAGGDAVRLAGTEQAASATPTPSPSPSSSAAEPLPTPLAREPAYAPDGATLAYVDMAGRLVMVELPAERLTSGALAAAGPISWLPDSSAVLVVGAELAAPLPLDEAPRHPPRTPVAPLDPTTAGVDDLAVLRLFRGSRDAQATSFDAPARLAIDGTGRIASVELAPDGLAGPIRVATSSGGAQGRVLAEGALLATWAAFTPERGTLIVARASPEGDELGIALVDVADGGATRLTADGRRPRWLP